MSASERGNTEAYGFYPRWLTKAAASVITGSCNPHAWQYGEHGMFWALTQFCSWRHLME